MQVPNEAKTTQPAEQKSCKNYNSNIIPTPTQNIQHSPATTKDQQQLQPQPYSQKSDTHYFFFFFKKPIPEYKIVH